MKKEINDTTVKDINNLFRLKRENKEIKDIIIRDISKLFELEEEDYYTPVRVSNFWINSYIEYESNNGRNKTLSFEEYLNKIRTILKRHVVNSINNSN